MPFTSKFLNFSKLKGVQRCPDTLYRDTLQANLMTLRLRAGVRARFVRACLRGRN